MAIYTVSRPNEEVTDRDYGEVMIGSRKYRVFRTSPLFGDLGYGVVKINGHTYSVYRSQVEDGDLGYGVVNIHKKIQKKQLKYNAKQLPEDLDEIVSVWQKLPENIKAQMKELVKNNRT